MSIIAILLLIIVVGIAYFYNVPKRISSQDISYIEKMISEAGYNPDDFRNPQNFEDEINCILAVQAAVFKASPDIELIPKGTPREPRDLYEARYGYCSDRARTMDKAYRHFGLPCLYVSLFRNHPDYSFLQILLMKGDEKYKNHSHALLEVKTSKGWIAVDTRSRWISLTPDYRPLSLQAMQKFKAVSDEKWSDKCTEAPYKSFNFPFYIAYGLYSRHGLFYPPYIKGLPNINWIEFLANIKKF